MAQPPLHHHDYAEEAEAAQRGEAWPQAAALWRRAADALRATAAHDDATFDLYAKYQAAAEQCDRKDRENALLERIARENLRIPTLQQRNSDGLDFHELAVWQIKKALAAAYEAGEAATPGQGSCLQPGMRLCIDGQDATGRWVATELATGQQIRL